MEMEPSQIELILLARRELRLQLDEDRFRQLREEVLAQVKERALSGLLKKP
jgi:hypothetical protein